MFSNTFRRHGYLPKSSFSRWVVKGSYKSGTRQSSNLPTSSDSRPPARRLKKEEHVSSAPDYRSDPFLQSVRSDSFQSFLEKLSSKDEIVIKVDNDTGKAITTPRTPKYSLIKKPFEKPFEASYQTVRPVHGVKRALDQLKPKPLTRFVKPGFKAFYDIIILGGGIMGCMVAYSIMETLPRGYNLAVIERDFTYQKSPLMLSVGGIRTQFSTPENIEMALYGADFYRHLDKFLYVHGQHLPTVHFQPHGYLFLATEKGASEMENNYRIQTCHGAKGELLSPSQIKRDFPWINTEGIALGSFSMENEGFINANTLLQALKVKCVDLGVDFIHGEVHNMVHKLQAHEQYKDTPDTWLDEQDRMFNRLSEVHVELTDGDVFPIHSSIFVVAGGCESGHLSYLAGVGSGRGVLSVPLPVVPKKRYIYNIQVPSTKGSPGLDTPMVVDPSGVFFRRNGYAGNFLTGRSPRVKSLEPKDIDNYDVDLDYFDEHVWPILSHRIPHLKNNATITDAWSTFYDHNLLDQNPFIGSHEMHENLYFATGFSGQGLQSCPALGRATAELITENEYRTLDLSRLHFNRLLRECELKETIIV